MDENDVNLTDPTETFDNARKVSNEDIVYGDLNSTKNAAEKYRIILKRDIFSKPNTQYLILAKAVDDAGMAAERVSNPARLCNDCTPPKEDTDKGFSGGAIFGIIVGALLLAALCGFLIFAALVFSGVVKKPNVKMPESFRMRNK